MNLRSKKVALAVFSATLLSSVALGAPAANASGTSQTVNGCYAQWWNTAAAGYCYNTSGVQVGLNVYCNGPDWNYYGSSRWIQGTAAPFDRSECTFSVWYSTLEFS